jgi:REP element-mobilizing transposase RayT
MFKVRKANRLKYFDYSSDNLYFVTSCVNDRICCLGEIKEGIMNLSIYGEIAKTQWFWLAKQYEYIILHAFVVMPNHIHGIIEINKNLLNVGTGRDLSLHSINNPCSSTEIKIKSLSELMGAYKTTSSKLIHLAGLKNFIWQRSFHDHIIRNHIAYQNISNYINENPSNWQEDDFYKKM